MDTECTPGPWVWKEYPKDHGHYYIYQQSGGLVATLTEFCSTSDTRAANAKLIAAAPETKAQRDQLLEALKLALIDLEHIGEHTNLPASTRQTIEKAQSALANAERTG